MDNVVTQQVVESARVLRRDILEFETRFPPLPSGHPPMPRFTWAELQRQLTDLSRLSAYSADQVAAVIEPLRLKALCGPPELLLRELLVTVSILLEEPPTDDGLAGR